MESRIDSIDAQIIEALQKDGRVKRSELAAMTGLSIPAVSERMKKLEDAGIIRGYAAMVDHRALGFDVAAFIAVTLDSSKHYKGFINHVQALPEVQECHAVTGKGTHLLKVRTKNTAALEKLLSKIQAWEGVTQTNTSVVLSSPKETVALSPLKQTNQITEK